LVDLDDPVGMHLPEFSGAGKNAITIRHLWTHTGALLNVEQRLFQTFTTSWRAIGDQRPSFSGIIGAPR
jgi:CubicO group peptidase (beta-lactamase class C family)